MSSFIRIRKELPLEEFKEIVTQLQTKYNTNELVLFQQTPYEEATMFEIYDEQTLQEAHDLLQYDRNNSEFLLLLKLVDFFN